MFLAIYNELILHKKIEKIVRFLFVRVTLLFLRSVVLKGYVYYVSLVRYLLLNVIMEFSMEFFSIKNILHLNFDRGNFLIFLEFTLYLHFFEK